ncbi:hypothetical protein B0H21DRAFT_543800 [Amylocystis lapponica]|nr:hypothetical protein B0H21DRAFT_543800 [Amylocystis lapponica]
MPGLVLKASTSADILTARLANMTCVDLDEFVVLPASGPASTTLSPDVYAINPDTFKDALRRGLRHSMDWASKLGNIRDVLRDILLFFLSGHCVLFWTVLYWRTREKTCRRGVSLDFVGSCFFGDNPFDNCPLVPGVSKRADVHSVAIKVPTTRTTDFQVALNEDDIGASSDAINTSFIPLSEDDVGLFSSDSATLDSDGDNDSSAASQVASAVGPPILPVDDNGCLIVSAITEEIASAFGLPTPPKKRKTSRGGKRRTVQIKRQNEGELRKYQELLASSGVPLPPFPSRKPSSSISPPQPLLLPTRPVNTSQLVLPRSLLPRPPEFGGNTPVGICAHDSGKGWEARGWTVVRARTRDDSESS